MLLSSEKSHFRLTVCLSFLFQKWGAAYERPSPTVDPASCSLTPLLLFVCDGLSVYSVFPLLGISASCILSAFYYPYIFPSPPFPHPSSVLLSSPFSLSFCPLQANPQTSIRSKQGSLTFNFLLATHFSIVCASPPFLGLFLCELNRWMDVPLDEWAGRRMDGMDEEGTWLFFFFFFFLGMAWVSASLAKALTARSLCGDVVGIFIPFLDNATLNVFRACQQ